MWIRVHSGSCPVSLGSPSEKPGLWFPFQEFLSPTPPPACVACSQLLAALTSLVSRGLFLLFLPAGLSPLFLYGHCCGAPGAQASAGGLSQGPWVSPGEGVSPVGIKPSTPPDSTLPQSAEPREAQARRLRERWQDAEWVMAAARLSRPSSGSSGSAGFAMLTTQRDPGSSSEARASKASVPSRVWVRGLGPPARQ
ncbi:unnamed protein product [Rangifer tarandus platyrhynchus]|uniref:Uncharacterized protein n=1 Tax=Rangifer tarandus platyrhynchus TaxID=3082113 RepID=A0AC60A573_RANTA